MAKQHCSYSLSSQNVHSFFGRKRGLKTCVRPRLSLFLALSMFPPLWPFVHLRSKCQHGHGSDVNAPLLTGNLKRSSPKENPLDMGVVSEVSCQSGEYVIHILPCDTRNLEKGPFAGLYSIHAGVSQDSPSNWLVSIWFPQYQPKPAHFE